MENPILSVRNLTTKLQIGSSYYAVVENFSFDLHAGKTLAIVGESGCGKSMLALSLMRILPSPPALPSEGEVIFNGVNLLTLSEKKMRAIRGGQVAMIFQDPSSCLNPVYTIGSQLVESVGLHHRIYGAEAKELAIQGLIEVGIASPEQQFDDYPHQLSGGMKQRVMIAMALIGEPEILIADEPTTALDVTIQAQVLDLIRALQKKRNMAVLLITHDIGIVAEYADEMIVMYASQDVERGKTLNLFNSPAHPYTKGLFQSRVSLAVQGNKLKPIQGSVPLLTHYPHGCRFHPRCPFVMQKCLHGPVPNFDLPEPDHRARCLLYE
ncbi:MAG: ABC transporter ATP-binding protein [Parachlamydiaceae bacterium]|nr:ABC transporter ATP-binding protein [Parachlamydiaceae bacterium]